MKSIISWLTIILGFVFALVIVGGITRLTGSGLSMVNWEPITGIFPPLTEADWQKVFSLYQSSPQYLKINLGMALAEFKDIFFWEYLHRILGRILGLVLILPYIYFLLRKKLPLHCKKSIPIIILLTALQGLLGWYMVKSGLIDHPEVSHLRLAAHLSLAFILLGLTLWTLLKVAWPKEKIKYSKKIGLAHLLPALIFIQVIYGALLAGLKGGLVYNTFPLMNGAWIPEGLFSLNPWLINFFENVITIQFIHRLLGTIIFLFVLWVGLSTLRKKHRYQLKRGLFLVLIVFIQFVLGILTLIGKVPMHAALTHQAIAMILFGTSLYFLHCEE